MRREKPAVIVLVVIALLCIVAGIVYITVLPSNLPSFFPGHVAKHAAVTTSTHPANGSGSATTATTKAKKHKTTTSHYWKRGVLLFIVAAILLAFAWSMSRARRRMLRHR